MTSPRPLQNYVKMKYQNFQYKISAKKNSLVIIRSSREVSLKYFLSTLEVIMDVVFMILK